MFHREIHTNSLSGAVTIPSYRIPFFFSTVIESLDLYPRNVRTDLQLLTILIASTLMLLVVMLMLTFPGPVVIKNYV